MVRRNLLSVVGLVFILVVMNIQVEIYPSPSPTASTLPQINENSFQLANENVRVVGSLPLYDSREISVEGNIVYVGIFDEPGYLVTIDITNVFAPIEADRFETLGYIPSIFVSDSLCYVVDRQTGLWILNVTDPYNIEPLGIFNTSAYTQSVFIENQLAYLGGFDGLRIVNISDPTNPTELGTYGSYLEISSIQVRDGFAYVLHEGGLVVVNVSDPNNPVYHSSYVVYVNLGGILLIDDIVLLRLYYSGVIFLNISDPSNPVEIANYEISGMISDIAVDSAFLYVVEGLYGIKIYQTQNNGNLTLQGSFDDGFRPRRAQVIDGYIYLVDVENGLWILEHDCDQDDLYSRREYEIGTPPDNPDADLDNLLDGPEVDIYHTDPFNDDSDSDTMPDGWEVENGLNPLINDAHEDADGDTLDNLFEYRLGTSPTLVDSDRDGYPDDWEYNNGYNPLDPYVGSDQFWERNSGWVSTSLIVVLGTVTVIYIIAKFRLSDEPRYHHYESSSWN